MSVEDIGKPQAPAAHTHDGFFKAVFSQPEHASAFFKSHLPVGISAKIDWPSLAVLPGSFVKSSLQQVHSDLLFSCRIGDRETLLYLLFEHQSSPDPAMPLRMLGYVTEILIQHHKAHGLPLPPVLPFVFHQGPEAWNVSTTFEDLFALPDQLPAELPPLLPKFQHALLDLSRFDPAMQEGDSRLRAILQLMKLARQKELLRFFQWLAGFSAAELPDSLLALMLLYALHADSDLDAEKIYHTLSSNPELEKNAMSVAEKLKAEGRVEGRAEGLRIGKIQAFEEFLEKPQTSRASLEAMPLAELEALHLELHREYEARFKRR
ncbi:MAG: Rpn family recombination-promoting nuclease/putative transposase [Akkermansiaceae bacterium]|jgi:predicted transposase/invertase (TIGR01784 family)|nr:Rpn family recombination-promoting nuclease/putative transposase [Akkermansiaceae bacterium]